MERLTPWEWIKAGFWLAFGLFAGSLALAALVFVALLLVAGGTFR